MEILAPARGSCLLFFTKPEMLVWPIVLLIKHRKRTVSKWLLIIPETVVDQNYSTKRALAKSVG